MDSVLRKRRRWMVRRRLEGWIHRKYGLAGLAVKSKAPYSYWKIPQDTVELILRLRTERCWGPCKIEGRPFLHQEIYSF